MSKKQILIVGTGSVGKRHARNLSQLGAAVSCVDPRPDRRDELAGEIELNASYPDMETALADRRFDGVVVGSPTRFHVEQSLAALDAGLPVLLEKPAAIDLDGAERLQRRQEETSTPLLLGYTWRWWPPLIEVRRRLTQGVVGKLHHVRFVMSAHLEDWHPGEPLSEFFMSSKELGGGALLDESHWLDLMIWFFGDPEQVFAQVETIGGLEIDSDDNVDMVVRYPDGLRVTVHLDLYGRPHEKSIQFSGDNGTMLWSESPNRIAICREMAADWQEELFTCERNEMFVAVAAEFMALLDGAPAMTCGISDGVKVMRVIDAARESHRRGTAISLHH